jgi:hypothetical protein
MGNIEIACQIPRLQEHERSQIPPFALAGILGRSIFCTVSTEVNYRVRI